MPARVWRHLHGALLKNVFSALNDSPFKVKESLLCWLNSTKYFLELNCWIEKGWICSHGNVNVCLINFYFLSSRRRRTPSSTTTCPVSWPCPSTCGRAMGRCWLTSVSWFLSHGLFFLLSLLFTCNFWNVPVFSTLIYHSTPGHARFICVFFFTLCLEF